MSDPSGAIDRLAKRLEELERRVHALEHPLAAPWPRPSPKQDAAPVSSPLAAANPSQQGSIFAVLGKAMLGIAGAYLLRAVEETSSLPRATVAWAGIVYAFLWLAVAARTRGASKLAAAIYSSTSVLILAPMLWELTLRFRLLPAPIAAAALCAYALAAYALTRNRDRASVLRVCAIATAGLSLALAIASHAPLPFIAALLLLAAFSEFVPERDRLLAIRAPLALAADVAIWNLIYIYFSPRSAHAGYPELSTAALLAPGAALLLIYAVSVGLQTAVRGVRITVFESLQLTAAFLLFAVSLADFAPVSGTMILGILCLILGATCFEAVFVVFAHQPETRNTAVFSAWGAALLLCGCLLCFPSAWAAGCLGAAAIAATFIGRRKRWLVFEFYGAIFLFAAAAEAGLLGFLIGALVGRPSAASSPVAALVALGAVVCYAAAKPHPDETRTSQALHLAVAALAVGAAAALAIEGLVTLIAYRVAPGAHHIAFIRTLTLCFASLALVFSGVRWRRVELTRLGYTALALVAVKLVAEDLRHGHLAYIAASIFLFAVTLIAAPRLARGGNKGEIQSAPLHR